MEKRQQILGLVVIALIAFVVIVRVGPWFIHPITSAGEDLEKCNKKYEDLSALVNEKSMLQQRYRALGKRTLGLDAEQVAKELRPILEPLAKSCRFIKPTVEVSPPRTYKDPRTKARITVVSGKVKAMGTAGSVVNFLDKFYRLPYLIQIRNLVLLGNLDKKGAVTLKVEIDVETLVLQRNSLVGKTRIETANLDPSKAGQSKRLARDNVGAYALVSSKDIFGPGKTTTPKASGRGPIAKRDRGQPQPKGGDPLVRVVLVTRYPWYDPTTGREFPIQEVLTRHEKRGEERLIRIDEALDIGTLVYVDSTGAVARTSDRKHYFYPVGMTLKDRQLLDPELHPDQYWAVQQLVKTEKQP